MTEMIFINGEGEFEIDGRSFRIPEHFSFREVLSYRSLVADVPDIPREKTLTAEQRSATEMFLLRRAVACVIPGFSMQVSEPLSPVLLQSIKQWIAGHRPSLSDPRPLRG